MPTQQHLVPAGVIVVVGENPDVALAAAAGLHGAGIAPAALHAVPATLGTPNVVTDVSKDVSRLLRKNKHVAVITTNPVTGVVAAAVQSARRIGRAATVLVAGSATFTAAWQSLATGTDIGADRALPYSDDLDLLLHHGQIDLRDWRGPFAVIGDVHGCQRTLEDRLLPAIGWRPRTERPTPASMVRGLVPGPRQPQAPLLVSVGDVHDKGTRSVASLRWWLKQMRAGAAVMTDSNHARALVRAIVRPDLPVRDCVADTLAAVDASPDAKQLRTDIVAVFGSLPTHLVLPGVVAVHAALTEQRLWRNDIENRRFAIHTRFHLTPWHWTHPYTLIHGHDTVTEVRTRQVATSVLRPKHVPGKVINIDTGAYAGGGLTAWLSWNQDTVTVPTVSDEITAALADEISPVCV